MGGVSVELNQLANLDVSHGSRLTRTTGYFRPPFFHLKVFDVTIYDFGLYNYWALRDYDRYLERETRMIRSRLTSMD